LSDFLASVDRRAFKQAVFAVHDEEAALDIVQDTMLRLSEKYSDRPAAELPLLFQRILQNAIRDWFRRSKVRSTWTTLLSAMGLGGEDDDADPLETLEVADEANVPASPQEQLEQSQVMVLIEEAVEGLPATSTRGFHAALLGGTRRERDSQGDGMLGGQRQDALLAGNPRVGESPEIKRDNAMNEKEFGAKLKPWLDRAAGEVGEMQATRLKSARLRALDAYQEPVRLLGLVTVSGGTAQVIRYSMVQRALLFLPVLLLIALLAVQSMQEPDLGELDAQLLTQELPPDAFLDQDFRSWLGKSRG
jgi:RNA polymerase sigma-70 factor, ECF subfamily